MSSLAWGIKASLLAYVRTMSDGRVEVSEGAQETPDGFSFPDAGAPLSFRGAVTLTGHSGMMRVVVADPAIVESSSGWSLTLRDDDDPSGRLEFATIEAFTLDDGVSSAGGAKLTTDGADLFFGPYAAGTALDTPRIVP